MENTFGERLKVIRLQKDLSQGALAAILGTSKQVISRYEQNKRIPKITVIQDYSQKLNIDLGYLLGEDNKNKPANEIGELTEKEKNFISWFRTLNKEQQDAVEILFASK